jgi:type IV pilus assembly protein PilA
VSRIPKAEATDEEAARPVWWHGDVDRAWNHDGGFTLIELMVVVAVLAILIAISLPLFIGARGRAQNRAAQASLRNAFAAAKVFYTDQETYSSFDGSAPGIEPSLTWVTDYASLVQDGGNTIAIIQDSGNDVLLVAWSQSGMYYGIADHLPTGSSLCSSSTLPSWATSGDCNNGW